MHLNNKLDIYIDNPFRNSQGRMYMKNLFYESSVDSEHKATMYTLKDQDYKGYPSLYKLYMESNDPTEWTFATKHLDGFEHWVMFCNANWFQPFLKRWRRDLELKIRSASLLRVLEEAERDDSKSKFSANRFLLEKGWADKQTKGRPTKQDIKREANRIFEQDQRILEDYERLAL